MQLLIFIYNNNGAEMQICALLTRIQCKVSDAQVTVKACGPLVCFVTLYVALEALTLSILYYDMIYWYAKFYKFKS